MGIIRSLTGSEIINQVIQSIAIASSTGMSPCRNVVFMGMGDAGMNLQGVSDASLALSDPSRMGFSASKVTISTVGPSPSSFMELASLPCSLAWSLHSPIDPVRRLLVPSTKHTTIELRDGLVEALKSRESVRTRAIMIACTLLKGVNDGDDDADELAEFIKPIVEVAKKVVIDIIPYNDIGFGGLVPPDEEDVKRFTKRLKDKGCFVAVRKSRGEEDNSACGMLATERVKKKGDERAV
jgi:23S rRNA (adenine2503-C2)-methyltransferase